ncbi:unnamed protein product [Adineta ricciae]|uniref:Uncharacterized protein n=1 Tax=Adineta ricciae TaxID=249248 RepID=A0A815FCM6_ADIRI|nr:unnamed protein product [Adineta ricciae]CAF1317327.1 unnamed protein product [Adineta ricciae]
MNAEKNTTAAHTSTSRSNSWDPLEYCRKHNFSVQSTPPLSIRQYVRSTIRNSHGDEPWKPSGIYHAKINNGDRNSSKALPHLKPEPRKEPHQDSRTPWFTAGIHRYVKSASLETKEKERQRLKDMKNKPKNNTQPRTVVKERIPWRPSGNRIFKPVPYFDCPSLRWSMEDVKRSMPEFQTTSTKSS